MKLVPANIKSKAEFAKRMADGEVFYNEFKDKLYFDENLLPFPFVFEDGLSGGRQALGAAWELYNCVTVESKWYENIPEGGILCWVWDEDEDKRSRALVITKYRGKRYSHPYEDKYAAGWENAEPVTKEDLKEV
jgi:hypothetical protein